MPQAAAAPAPTADASALRWLDTARAAIRDGELGRAAAALDAARDAGGPSAALAEVGLRLTLARAVAAEGRLTSEDRSRVRWALEALGWTSADPKDALYAAAAARLEWERGRLEAAQDALTTAVRLDPAFTGGHNALGLLFRQTGRGVEALRAFEAASRTERPGQSVLNNLAVQYADLARNEDALAAFARALDVEPTALTHANAGGLLTKLGRHAEAADHYRAALVLEPAGTAFAQALGESLFAGGKTQEAEPHLLRAAAANPEPQLLLRLGAIAEARQDAPAAIERYGQLLRLDPSHPMALVSIARAYSSAGRNDDARAALEAYMRVTANNPDEVARRAEVTVQLARLSGPPVAPDVPPPLPGAPTAP